MNSKLKLNKTKDDQDFLSLSEPGTEYLKTSQRNLWEQGDTNNANNNSRRVQPLSTTFRSIKSKGTTKIEKVINFILMKKTIKSKQDTTPKTTPSISIEKPTQSISTKQNSSISIKDELKQALLENPTLCQDYGDSLCTS